MEISVEGVVLLNKPLTNVELLNAANKLGIPNFRGVFQRDALPKRSRKGESDLIFSHPRSEGWPHHGRTFSIYPCPLSF